MYNLLKSKNECLKDELIAFTQKLIRTPSPSLAESGVAALVEEELRRVPCDKVFRDEVGNTVGVLLGRETEPTVLLNCHMDTVPPHQESLWKESPYSGTIQEDRMVGLGAADCKGGLAAHIFTAALLKRSLLPLRGNLVIAATVAEENGCSVGVRHLLEKTLPAMNIFPTYVILGEPTGLGLYYGHDGWIEMDIQVEGSNPFLVDDAAHAIFNEYSSRTLEDRARGLCIGRGLSTRAACDAPPSRWIAGCGPRKMSDRFSRKPNTRPRWPPRRPAPLRSPWL